MTWKRGTCDRNAQVTALVETEQGYLVAYIDTGRGSLGEQAIHIVHI